MSLHSRDRMIIGVNSNNDIKTVLKPYHCAGVHNNVADSLGWGSDGDLPDGWSERHGHSVCAKCSAHADLKLYP